jgi:hypothetical protein
MRIAIALVAIPFLFVGAAWAETEVVHISPADDSVCKMTQEIVVVRCETGAAAYCENPTGSAMHYSCINGVPMQTLDQPPVRAAHAIPRKVHRSHPIGRKNRSLFDLLFRR